MAGDDRDDPLAEYRRKRDFRRTAEPDGSGGREEDSPVFVIQEHAASSHHFDFRLEIDGVLVSWAVPKGPSTDPRDKRLAVRTEDHPLDYAGFEGVIPEGEYGAGAVIVWDAGPYRNLRRDEDGEPLPLATCLEQGTIEIELAGDKLTGGYALVHARVGGDDDNWLLVKMDDDAADARRRPTRTEPDSVRSGRTVDDVADEEGESDDGG